MKHATIALVLACGLLLTGCSDDQNTASAETPDATVSGETVAPLVAEEVAPGDGVPDEVAFVELVRQNLTSATVIPNATDDQLILAGWEACAQREAGVHGDDVTVIEGEVRNELGYYTDSGIILSAARKELCPVN